MIGALLFTRSRKLLSVPPVQFRRNISNDAELLVLRHENSILLRQITGRAPYQPADCFRLPRSLADPPISPAHRLPRHPSDPARLAPPVHQQRRLRRTPTSQRTGPYPYGDQISSRSSIIARCESSSNDAGDRRRYSGRHLSPHRRFPGSSHRLQHAAPTRGSRRGRVTNR